METDHFHQMVRPHSRSVNLMDTDTVTDIVMVTDTMMVTVGVNRPLLLKKKRSQIRAYLLVCNNDHTDTCQRITPALDFEYISS